MQLCYLTQPDITLLPDARRGEPEGGRASPWTAVSPTEFINVLLVNFGH